MNHINSFKIELVLYLKVHLMLCFQKHCFFFYIYIAHWNIIGHSLSSDAYLFPCYMAGLFVTVLLIMLEYLNNPFLFPFPFHL